MDRDEALAQLPTIYARALQLRDQEWLPAAIAAAVGVEVEAIGPLLDLAEAKLERLLTASMPTPE